MRGSDMNENITLFSGTAAFLWRDGYWLLMKRSPEKAIAPGVWSGVGGKIEQDEMNSPLSACLREVYEETGISSENIYNLELRYIIIRRAKNVIRQSYIYFGETDKCNFSDTREGALCWVPEAELLDREFTKTFDAMLRHYICTPDEKGRVVVGVAENIGDKLHMSWSVLEDFE